MTATLFFRTASARCRAQPTNSALPNPTGRGDWVDLRLRSLCNLIARRKLASHLKLSGAARLRADLRNHRSEALGSLEAGRLISLISRPWAAPLQPQHCPTNFLFSLRQRRRKPENNNILRQLTGLIIC
jgi:hypothetical protein